MRWLGSILLAIASIAVGMLAIRAMSEGVYRGSDWAYIGLGLGTLLVAAALFYGVYRLAIGAAAPARIQGAPEAPSSLHALAGIGWAAYGGLLLWACWGEVRVGLGGPGLGFAAVMLVESLVVFGLAYFIGIRRNRIAAVMAVAFGMGVLLLGPIVGLPVLFGPMQGLGLLSLTIVLTAVAMPRLHGGIRLSLGRLLAPRRHASA
jgi:hypothetical protein